MIVRLALDVNVFDESVLKKKVLENNPDLENDPDLGIADYVREAILDPGASVARVDMGIEIIEIKQEATAF